MTEYVKIPTAILTGALDLVKAVDCYLKLYSNDYTPVAGMTGASFTEVTGGGYAQKSIAGDETSPSDWTEEYANTPPDIILAEQTFTFTGAIGGSGIVYGWYLVDQDDTSVVKAAKRLDTPYTPASGGGTLKFTPRVQAGGGTPA